MSAEQVLREAEAILKAGDALGAERKLATLWADTSKAPGAALHMLGDIRRMQRRIPDAERFFRRAIQAEPGEARHHKALGDLLVSVNLQTYAVDAYAEALRIDPNAVQTLDAFVRSALAAGRADEAEDAARRLTVAAPSADSLNLLAVVLRSQDKLEEALQAADRALVLDPRDLTAAHTRTTILARNGRNEEALADLDGLSARGVAAPAIVFTRGTALFNLTRTAEAEAVFAEGVARWPADANLHTALANARWMRGDEARFTRDFEAAVERHADNIQLRLLCADLLRRADQHEKSEAILRAGLARAPNDVALNQSLGVLLDEIGRPADALPLLQHALHAAPGMIQIRGNLTNVLLRLGRADEALREIEALRRATPLNQEWICYETMALRQLGHSRYRELCDYDHMVRAYDLAAPAGYASIEAFNAALAESLARLHVLETHPLDQSLRGGSQTSRSLIYVDDPVIQTYLSALAEPIHAYIDAMGAPDRNHPWSGRKTGKYKLSGAWSVKLRANGFHVNHLHPAGWISSAYYVSLPAIMASGADQQGWIKFGEPRWPTPGCTVEKVVQPKAGRLVLFPSYMWHGTIPFSEGERLTAPFDAVPA